MNAIAQLHPTEQAEREQAERRARHLSVCQELIDIGMKLARRAGERALEADAKRQSRDEPPAIDEDQTFARLATSVRLAVKLEAQIANNAFARPVSAPSTPGAPSKNLDDLLAAANHGTLSTALHILTEHHEDRWQLNETIDEIIEDTLETFPNDPLSTHFTRACLALDIEPDLASLPPDVVEFLTPPTPAPPADTQSNTAPPERWPKDEAA